MHLVILLFVVLLLAGAEGLKNVELLLPLAVRSGSWVQIICRYDLEGAMLYSVKFYQGDMEFYRFVPKESPPTRVFQLPGVKVNLLRSNSTMVTLAHVRRELTGTYKCEVSADAPLFHTVIRSAQLIVTDEPVSPPLLTVGKSKVAIGERLRANCSSRSGFPAANLTFYINGAQVINTGENRLWLYVEAERSGLESTLLEMEVLVLPAMMAQGRMELSCVATQFSLYKQVVDTVLFEDTPQLAHVLGPTLSSDSIARTPFNSLLTLLLASILIWYQIYNIPSR